jgi:hypothetical protein
MDPVFDPEFRPQVKSKRRNFWMHSQWTLGRFASVIVLGGLAILSAQNTPGRLRNPQSNPGGLSFTPNGYQVVPQATARLRFAAGGDHFVRSAPAGIDERFVIPAPVEIDQKMIIHSDQRVRIWSGDPPANPPVYPYVVPIPTQPLPAPPR